MGLEPWHSGLWVQSLATLPHLLIKYLLISLQIKTLAMQKKVLLDITAITQLYKKSW